MIFLIIASLIWCFSFGLIGNTLAELPRAWIATMRLFIAMLIFIPFLKKTSVRTCTKLFGIGAIQFGIMYLAYMHSFNYLKSHEVALFTIFTPIYVSLINDLQKRSFNLRNLLTAGLAVIGSGIILWNKESRMESLLGFGLLQVAGICFSVGQLSYRNIFKDKASVLPRQEDHNVFAWLYAGGVAVLAPIAIVECSQGLPYPTSTQLATIFYLGVVASGIAFFLWNRGCRRVSAGTLAVMNNLKIPTGVLVSLLVFKEATNIAALLTGSVLIGAAILATAKKMNV